MKEIRICFLGESSVNGTGDSECLGWAGRICQDAFSKGFDVTYYNLGVRGETSSELRKRWLEEVSYRLPQKYDGRIVFSFGANDTNIENAKTRVALEDSTNNLRDILSIAKDLYSILVISAPPVDDKEHNQRICDLSVEFAKVCNEFNIPYLDIVSELIKSDIWINEVRNYDGAHPRAGGYKVFAEIVKSWDGWLNWF